MGGNVSGIDGNGGDGSCINGNSSNGRGWQWPEQQLTTVVVATEMAVAIKKVACGIVKSRSSGGDKW